LSPPALAQHVRVTTAEPNSTQPCALSIIIPVCNDWTALEGCLRSIKEQDTPPDFEVIIVDDGSQEPAPESIRRWNESYPCTIIRQSHAGIPSARNRGIQQSKGEVLLFTDADCRFQPGSLSALARALAGWPRQDCFQLHIVGDPRNIVGRAEKLRLIAIQQKSLQADGRIRYLNTAGFAIRRSRLSLDSMLFNPAARRAEDTLLLANLIKSDELPLLVRDSIVQHSISLSFWECLRKDVRTGRSEGKTSRLIQHTGIRVRMRNMDRLRMLASTWKLARDPSIGRWAWSVLVTRQFVERAVTTLYNYISR
jgi:glycosyltransferase involved in cell wall biosynthesis